MAENFSQYDEQRLQALIEAKCNGSLDDAESIELESILMSSESACRAYWEAIEIHADLQWELSNRETLRAAVQRLSIDDDATADLTRSSGASSDTSPWGTPSKFGFLLALAACLLVGVFLGTRGPWRNLAEKAREPANRQAERATEQAPILGQLTSILPDSRWSFGRKSFRNTSDIHMGDTVSIDSGAVQLKLTSNVVAQMKAPLVLHMESLNRVRLLSGRIQVDVPEGAEGFSVDTAAAEIVDLGTSFSVEVVSGGTDLVVHQGEVDLKVPDPSDANATQQAPAKRFRAGEAVHVRFDGTLSRIINVRATDLAMDGDNETTLPLITSVTDNLVRDDLWSFYEIVPAGLEEDAAAFVDRPHEWNGLTEAGIPEYLLGADYVKTFNDDKVTHDLRIELELQGPAKVYVFMDKRLTPPTWLVEQFENTDDEIGIDEAFPERGHQPRVGPARSVERGISIWKLVTEAPGIVTLGPNGSASPEEELQGVDAKSNMYGIAAVRIE